jgi:peptide/nickel transport system permease protein
MLGEFASGADREALRKAMGLNLPIAQQWYGYMSGLLQGDFGMSLYSHEAVFDIILARIPVTVQLAFAGLSVALILGFPAGVLAAVNYQKASDRSLMAGANLGMAIPNFVLGPLLILFFSVFLPWFPVSGQQGSAALVLPALTLGSAMAGILARMLRASLLDTFNQDYIRTARAKGLSNTRILLLHAMLNAMLPVVTLLGLQLGALLAGTIITERVFSWPGIGSLLIESIERRDYPVLQGCVLLISLTYVVINMLAEFAIHLIDPRLRRN